MDLLIDRKAENPLMETLARIMTPAQLETAGLATLRYGLVLVLFWIGAMKFTAFEAAAIKPLIETSPFLGWLYRFVDPSTLSHLLGLAELSAALMIGLRPYSARLAALGSSFAVLMFLATFSFLFSLPGWEPSLGGFPALSSAGGFLVKDICLLGIAIWSLGEATIALRSDPCAKMAAAAAVPGIRRTPWR